MKQSQARTKGFNEGAAYAHNWPNSQLSMVISQAERSAKLLFDNNTERALGYAASFVAGYFLGIINEYSTETTEADGTGPT